MKNLLQYIYGILFVLILWTLHLKIKYQIVIAGYFTNEIVLLSILVFFPILYFFFRKNTALNEDKFLSKIAYFPIVFLVLHLIPFLNMILFFLFTIPFLGYEKEKIAETEHFRLEKVSDIISSGGQANFEIYQKGVYFDTCIKKFEESKYRIEKVKFYEASNCFKIEY